MTDLPVTKFRWNYYQYKLVDRVEQRQVSKREGTVRDEHFDLTT